MTTNTENVLFSEMFHAYNNGKLAIALHDAHLNKYIEDTLIRPEVKVATGEPVSYTLTLMHFDRHAETELEVGRSNVTFSEENNPFEIAAQAQVDLLIAKAIEIFSTVQAFDSK